MTCCCQITEYTFSSLVEAMSWQVRAVAFYFIISTVKCCTDDFSVIAFAIRMLLVFNELSRPQEVNKIFWPFWHIIPVCNSCRKADCISYWVIKLGAGTLTRLHNHWHFPIQTTARLQSICCCNLVEELTSKTEACFIPCVLGGMENMISTAQQWHIHTHIPTGTCTPTQADINSCKRMS